MSRKVLKAFVPLLAFVAMAAVPAMAQAVTLESGGEALEPGALLTGFSSNLVFTGSAGETLECTQNHLVGEVETNGAQTSTSKINSATFTGTGGGACATNIPGVTADVTPVASTLPWILHFSPGDKWSLTHPIFTATFTANGTSVAHCTFTASEVKGTYTTAPAQLKFTVTSGVFSQIAPSTNCGSATGNLTGETTATTTGGAAVQAS
jgi:hypothetical protein